MATTNTTALLVVAQVRDKEIRVFARPQAAGGEVMEILNAEKIRLLKDAGWCVWCPHKNEAIPELEEQAKSICDAALALWKVVWAAQKYRRLRNGDWVFDCDADEAWSRLEKALDELEEN